MAFSIRPDGIMDPEGRYPNPLTGNPYSKAYLHLANKKKPDGTPDGWVKFDTWRDRIDIIKKIHKYSILMVRIPPGTGKTVIIPKLLLHYFGYGRPVIATGPKQVTVREAAEFSAKCLDVPLYYTDDTGDDLKDERENRIETGLRVVGYKHGAEKNKANSNTLLLFTTDGTVKQTILGGDVNLSKYGGVIVDEVHERSVNIDIVIAMLMDIVKRRPDFKVIFVSATMDLDLFADYFKRINLENAYSVYTLPDSQPPFKRDLVKETKKINTGDLVNVVYNKINDIILNPRLPIGNILAFVTSDPEAGKIKKKIERNMRNYPPNNKPYPIPFTAGTPQIEQNIATKKNTLQTVKPNPDAPEGFARKVVIGTNAVESSVTFSDNIVYVIETGMAYEKTYDPDNYCYVTGKNYISRASIEQRCGRTGRTCNGYCYQLYTDSQLKSFAEFTAPKILEEDITKEFLGIITLPDNGGNLQKGLEYLYRMIEPTKNYQSSIRRAYHNLINMDFLDSAGNVTPLGYICKTFNKFDLKIAKMIVGGYYLQCLQEVIILGAILQSIQSVDEFFIKPPGMDEDKQLEARYMANMKRFLQPRGDHITLLFIYSYWSNSPEPDKFANENGLDNRKLVNINKTIKDLQKEVEGILQYLPTLNLFTYSTTTVTQTGGSSYPSYPSYPSYYNGPSQPIELINGAFRGGYLFDGEDDYLDSDDGDSDDDTTSSTKSSDDEDENYLNKISRMPSTQEIETIYNNTISQMSGGYSSINNSNSNLILLPSQTKSLLDEIRHDSQKIIQNNKTNSNIFDIDRGYVGGNRRFINRKFTVKNINQETYIPHLQSIIIGGGTKAEVKKEREEKEKELLKKVERNRKIMEIISLKNLGNNKLLKLTPNGINRIHAALYYGFSNNIATYTGVGKKYYVKFSPEKASISKSALDLRETTPAWVIYNEFTIMKTAGRPDDATLNIVSELTTDDFLTFLDINEIRKQL